MTAKSISFRNQSNSLPAEPEENIIEERNEKEQLSEYHRNCVEKVMKNGSNQRDAKWTESIAVGDQEFVMEKQLQ